MEIDITYNKYESFKSKGSIWELKQLDYWFEIVTLFVIEPFSPDLCQIISKSVVELTQLRSCV